MFSFDEVGEILDDIAIKLPEDLYNELNGGINLLPDTKEHPAVESGDLYIMGEYCYNNLGRYINIYYGSVMRAFSHLPTEQLKEEIDRILKHEFTHHLESMAGENALEIKDAMELEDFKQMKKK